MEWKKKKKGLETLNFFFLLKRCIFRIQCHAQNPAKDASTMVKHACLEHVHMKKGKAA